MLTHTLRAEWTKLSTTRSFLVITAVYLLMSVAIAGLVGFGSASFAESIDPAEVQALFSPAGFLVGVVQAFPVLIMLAVLMVTGEYNHNAASVTFAATPKRWVVAVSKFVLAAALTFVTIVVALIVSLYVGRATAGDYAAGMELWEDAFVQRQMWALPIGMIVLIGLAMGVSWIIRSTAGALALVLLWWAGLESVFATVIPRVGRFVAYYGPITNLRAFLDAQPITDAPWGVGGSLAYSALWAVLAMIVGVVVLQRRDV